MKTLPSPSRLGLTRSDRKARGSVELTRYDLSGVLLIIVNDGPEIGIDPQAERANTYNRVPGWVMPVARSIIFVTDGVLAAVCFLAAFSLREGQPILSSSAWAWSRQFIPYAGILFLVIPARLGLLVYQRIYRFAGAFTYLQEMIRIFKAVTVSSLLIVAWAFLFRGGFSFRDFSYSRGVFLLDFVLSLALFSMFHLALRCIQVRLRERGINLIPTLIIGTNAEADQTLQALRKRSSLGYRVFGLIEGSDAKGLEPVVEFDNGERAPVLGRLDDLPELISTYHIQEVIITDNYVESERLFEVMMSIDRKRKVEFRFAPSLFDLLPQKTSVEQIGVLPMVGLFREPLTDTQRFVKRLSDLMIAAFAALITLPVWIVISILVRSDSRGPILYKQERVGMDGRRFLCYKFRTMFADADDAAHREMYQKNIDGAPEANAGDERKPVYGKVRNDPRITRIGRWLRRTSLDELPQVLNVFRGDMSMVGPRPPIPYEVEEYDTWHRKRLDMKPGITGLWQVSGRNRLTFEEMVRVDLFYIENWSLLLDLKILMLTLPAIFRGDGAK